MFYFFYGTDLESFKNIIRMKNIYASYYLQNKFKKYIRMIVSKYIFTNIYIDGLPLNDNENKGLGKITFIIDPNILDYKKCYFNKGWISDINDKTIVMNNNINYVINYLKTHYTYPYILTHEALFKKNISICFIIGIICDKELENSVRKYLNKYGYIKIKIFNKFPTFIC